MPSPFPGMNPYLEQDAVWPDFHQTFLTAARAALAGRVGPNYVVRIEERLYVHEQGYESRFVGRSDVSVAIEAPRGQPRGTGAIAAPEAPVRMRLTPAVDVERDGFI